MSQTSGSEKIDNARDPATKADLRELELRLAAQIAQSRLETLKWIFAMFLAFGTALVALLK